jgi:predicted metal-binding membrane protein
VVGSCLAVIVIAAWLYLLRFAVGMSDMASMPGMSVEPWGRTDLLLLCVMWIVMMIAMMTPSAAPMIFAFLGVNERRRNSNRRTIPAYLFIFGYIVIWSVYSAAATLAQWSLHEATLISPAMVVTSPLLQGGILIAAGAFQWTSLKRVCLAGCRSPLSFLMSQWREGRWGAFVMGLRHGSYCVGCCWLLMALLFVAGVMNLFWVALIAAFVMVEKIVRHGELAGRITGVALAVAGIVIIIRAG